MASTEKLPSGMWRTRIHIGNGKYKSFTGKTKKEAERLSYDYITAHPIINMSRIGSATFEEAAIAYITSKSNVLSPATIREYYKLINGYYYDLIKCRKLDSIAKSDIQQIINDLSSHLSPKTVRNAFAFIKSVYDTYLPRYDISITLPQRNKKEIIIPTDEEVKIIIESTKGTKYYIPFMLAAYCGLRRSEILALTVEDIDIRNSKVRVNKALVQNKDHQWEIKQTKTTSSTRLVLMPDSLVKEIASVLKDKYRDDRLYSYYPSTLLNALNRILRDKNMAKYRFHDLRHYYCSKLLAANMPMQFIADQLGHSSFKMIQEVYGHIMRDEIAGYQASLNNIF